MIITAIETIAGGRGRAEIFLDEAFAFILYKTEIRDLKLTVGEALSDADYEQIMNEILPKRAKLRAMHLLTKRPYTERKLREKLADGRYPDACIEAAVEYVKSYRYLDDLQYAKDYIDYRKTEHNRRKLTTALMEKGIDKTVIEEAFAAVLPEEESRTAEQEMLAKELRKKHYDHDTWDYEMRAKLKAALMRKGFSSESIRKAFDTFDSGCVTDS